MLKAANLLENWLMLVDMVKKDKMIGKSAIEQAQVDHWKTCRY